MKADAYFMMRLKKGRRPWPTGGVGCDCRPVFSTILTPFALAMAG